MEQFGDHYAAYVTFLKEARQQILQMFDGDAKKQRLAELLDPQILQWFEQGEKQKCEAWLQQRIGEQQ